MMCVAIAAILLAHGKLESAETVMFVMAIMTVVGAASVVIGGLGQASMLGLELRLVKMVLDVEPVCHAGRARPSTFEGDIRLLNVSYRHAPRAPLAANGVSLQVAPGQHVGIAGASRSGKSTIIQLILGLATPESGQVVIDGVDLAELDAAFFRQSVAIVSQDGRLFPGTLLDNLAVGRPVTEQEAWKALEKACLRKEIEALPLGLSTPISDTNPPLSGGQIQRLLLARGFLMSPKVFVLDEATSALDEATQAVIYGHIEETGATVISVAHRLETLRHCAKIFVVADGEIVESGSYGELSRSTSRFRDLLNAEQSAS